MALRVACQEILEGMEANSEVRTVRGWKLLVLPRMMLFRPLRGGVVSRKKLESRVRQFQEGDWISLLRESVSCAEVAHSSVVRRRRRRDPDEESARASRALSLVHMAELSADRQALEGASVAPGNLATLGMLTDPTRRPPVPRGVLSQEVQGAQPAEPFTLDPMEFLICLRKACRGAAAGPSGMTSDHLFPVLENEGDSQRLVEVASLFAVGRVPEEIVEGLRLGRLTALCKPDGGVRGIVVGDILRRIVARTIAKQIAKKVEEATAPFQYALSTKAGCECVAHVLQSMTDLNPEVTVTSIDGVGAYDLISRSAMSAHRLTCGKTSWGSRSTSHRGREGSKAIPSCLCSSLWANIRPSLKPKQDCPVMRSYSLSWTTSTSPVRRAGCWISGTTQTSTSTMARPKCGIVEVWNLRASQS